MYEIVSALNIQRLLFLSVILYTHLVLQCINYLHSIYILLCVLRNQEMDCIEGRVMFGYIQVFSLLFKILAIHRFSYLLISLHQCPQNAKE